MMSNNIQLILCVESNNQARTDYFYIQSVLDYFYSIKENKLSYLFLGSKHKYNSKKTIKDIKKRTKDFAQSANRKSIVIYFLDKDYNNLRTEDKNFIEVVEKYCLDNEYLLVWFVKNIEEVMLNKEEPNKTKIKKAQTFYRKELIKLIDVDRLSAPNDVNTAGKSNILTILNSIKEIKRF